MPTLTMTSCWRSAAANEPWTLRQPRKARSLHWETLRFWRSLPNTAGKDSPGVFIVSQFEPIGPVVEVLMMVWSASNPSEWRNQIRYLPSLTPHLFHR